MANLRLNDREDDGTGEWMAESAAGLIGVAWMREMKTGNKKEAAEMMLRLADHARSFISNEQWKLLGQSRSIKDI